jgi:hypothetical protein
MASDPTVGKSTSPPIRRNYNLWYIRAPTPHLVAFVEIAFISVFSRRMNRLFANELRA